jgi:hypothetical protein
MRLPHARAVINVRLDSLYVVSCGCAFHGDFEACALRKEIAVSDLRDVLRGIGASEQRSQPITRASIR